MSMKPPHTIYRKSVRPPTANTLKPGKNNKKLGWLVTARKWVGKKIFSVTLEERATCPTTCHHWEDCYGNKMPFAHRHSKKGLIPQLRREVGDLISRHPSGIVIRLHVLGDFYSIPYVQFWRKMLVEHPTLSIFGYTARMDRIGRCILDLNRDYPEQCVIRYSSNCETINYPEKTLFAANEDFEGQHFVCPEQTGKVKSCADCGLCWTSPRTVKFLTH